MDWMPASEPRLAQALSSSDHSGTSGGPVARMADQPSAVYSLVAAAPAAHCLTVPASSGSTEPLAAALAWGEAPSLAPAFGPSAASHASVRSAAAAAIEAASSNGTSNPVM